MADHPPLDAERVVEVLDRHGVVYILVGGVAALLHGARRPTLDIDLLPLSDRENLEHLAAALKELSAHLRVGGIADEEARALPVVLDGAALQGMAVSTWRTEAGDLDVLQHLRSSTGDRLPYEQLGPRATEVEVNGVLVRLAALDDIIASKRFADREKDREALPELERLLSEQE